MKKIAAALLFLTSICLLLAACGEKNTPSSALADGTYLVDFNTDGSMFHVNETCNGKGVLTVRDGQMSVHITLPSKNILNLYMGSAGEAEKEGAALLDPTEDSVTYDDGITETVHGFDVPVPYLDREFPCAIVGKKGVWYDHAVSVSNPESMAGDAG